MSMSFEQWLVVDQELWLQTDWRARDYKDLIADNQDPIDAVGYFYDENGSFTRPIKLVKYIRSNNIYPPYYGPLYDSELLEFMKQNNFYYPQFDGRTYGRYSIFDRFESADAYDSLSR